jgi:hypothetical protein
MAHEASRHGTEVYDETEAYDREHGKPGKDHEPVDLSPAQNRPAPHDTPFKNLIGK